MAKVALNSLAGPLLHATWGCIAPFSRLVVIQKRDIHENSKLDMEPFRKNIAYASVNLITLFNLNCTSVDNSPFFLCHYHRIFSLCRDLPIP